MSKCRRCFGDGGTTVNYTEGEHQYSYSRHDDCIMNTWERTKRPPFSTGFFEFRSNMFIRVNVPTPAVSAYENPNLHYRGDSIKARSIKRPNRIKIASRMKEEAATLLRLWAEEMRSGILPYVVAVAAVFYMTGIIKLTNADSSMVNIPMLYLLAVQAVAFFLGSRPAVLASIAAFLAFDWFFVTPIYNFTVSDPFEFVALTVFLVTAMIIGQLTALFQSRAQDARRREKAATALAQATWTVASEIDTSQALKKILKHLAYIDSFEEAAVLMQDQDENFSVWSCFPPESANRSIDQKAAEFVFTNGRPIGWEDNAQWQKALATAGERTDLYLPIMSEEKTLAVLHVELSARKSLSDEDRQVLNSMVNHLAVVIQRDRLVRVQALSQALAEADRLKTALLQMVSHDFRSPLASIKGSVSCLFEEDGTPLDTETKHSLLQAIDAETDRLNKLVGNILDLSRLESGTWEPLREITPIDELIGATS